MHQRVAGRGNTGRLPDRTQIADLLRNYCELLLTSCPESETLLIFHEDPDQLSARERETLGGHLGICLDCRDKLEWLKESEASTYSDSLVRVIWYTLGVHHPSEEAASRSCSSGGSAGKPNSLDPRAVRRDAGETAAARKAKAPFFASGDGALHGEIRQDRNHRMYFRITRLPRSFQWHALHIRALTFDRRLLVSRSRTISGPRFPIDHPPRITPGDMDRVELGLIPLRRAPAGASPVQSTGSHGLISDRNTGIKRLTNDDAQVRYEVSEGCAEQDARTSGTGGITVHSNRLE